MLNMQPTDHLLTRVARKHVKDGTARSGVDILACFSIKVNHARAKTRGPHRFDHRR
jgi:hypothetical protein